jgi:soluble lytic murein transglycosylase-like protein
MPTVAAFLVGLAMLSPGADASLSQYLALRKKHGVTHTVGVDALDSLVGSKVCEVRGIVKGTFRVDDAYSLLLERSDGDTYVVDAASIPAWLVGTDVPARLLVSASRESEFAPLKAKLIAAARDEQVKTVETKNPPKKAVKTTKTTRTRPASRTSRGGSTRSWSLPASEVTPIYAAFIKQINPRLGNAEASRIAQGIVGFSLKYGVDPRLIMAIVMVESGFNPNATSRVGAMGLGQLMPGTADGLGVRNAYDSVENIYGMVKLVRTHLDDYRRRTDDEYEAIALALAAYNAGAGAVRRHGGVPPYRETQNYVRKVIGLYQAFIGQG